MAFVQQQEDKQNQQGQGGQGGAVSTSSAPGAGPGMAPATSATGAVASNQASPQPFTNLQAYLTANAPQISQMGQNIAGQIGQNYGQIQNDIQSGTQGFQDAVKSGYTAPDTNLVTQAASNPTEFAKDPNNVAAFQKQLNNKYTGPSNFEGSDYYANLNREVQDAASQASLVNTPEGVKQYLMGLEYNPTKGDTTLDQVLLNTDQNVSKQIAQAAQPSLTLPQTLASIVPQQNQAVQDAIQKASQGSQAANTALSAKEQELENNLRSKLASTQSGYEKYNSDLSSLMGILNQPVTSLPLAYQQANKIDPRLGSALAGISNFNLYDSPEGFSVPLGSTYISPQQEISPPSIKDITSPEDLSEANALALLSGGAYKPSVTESGSYNLPSLPSFNQGQLAASLWQLINNINHPQFTNIPNPTPAMEGYQYAIDNLRDYLGIASPPPTEPTTPPVVTPPTVTPVQPPPNKTYAPPPVI